MSDERDMPPERPRYEIAAIADEIMADVRHYYAPAAIEHQPAQALRSSIIGWLLYVRQEAARAWLGSPLDRGRGDD